MDNPKMSQKVRLPFENMQLDWLTNRMPHRQAFCMLVFTVDFFKIF